MRLKRQTIFNFTCLLITVFTLILYYKHCYVYEYADDGEELYANFYKKARHKIVLDENQVPFEYGPDFPLIFIGGFPRSGTTLMRAMLDAHPDVRCGEETRVIPRILGMRSQWKRSEKEWKRLQEAGITDRVLDSAISSFILEVIAKHGRPAKRFCNKDPFALKSVEYLSQLFPRAKFVLMLRDGRAVIHSVISRKVTITGFDLTNHRQCLQKWNDAVSQMYHQCYLVGDKCLPIYYEQLVLEPERWMREILQFLELPWNDSVLHHEMFIGKQIRLSKTEKSSDQVVKAVYTEALTKWVGQFPDDVVKEMASIAPMLSYLGYDPKANPPKYAVGTNFYKKFNKNYTIPSKTADVLQQHNSNSINNNINQSNNNYSASTSNNFNNHNTNNENDIKTITKKLVPPRKRDQQQPHQHNASNRRSFYVNYFILILLSFFSVLLLLLPKILLL